MTHRYGLTKKEKLEKFDDLQHEHDLLQRYFWDTRDGLHPDATTRVRTMHGDTCKLSVYGTVRADGGYIVVEWNPGCPYIQYFDDWNNMVDRAIGGDAEFALKMALENLNRLLAVRDTELVD